MEIFRCLQLFTKAKVDLLIDEHVMSPFEAFSLLIYCLPSTSLWTLFIKHHLNAYSQPPCLYTVPCTSP